MNFNLLNQHLSDFWMGISGGLVQFGFVIWALLQGCLLQFLNMVRYIELLIRGLLFITFLVPLSLIIKIIFLIRKLTLIYYYKSPPTIATRQVAREIILFRQELEEKSW